MRTPFGEIVPREGTGDHGKGARGGTAKGRGPFAHRTDCRFPQAYISRCAASMAETSPFSASWFAGTLDMMAITYGPFCA